MPNYLELLYFAASLSHYSHDATIRILEDDVCKVDVGFVVTPHNRFFGIGIDSYCISFHELGDDHTYSSRICSSRVPLGIPLEMDLFQ